MPTQIILIMNKFLSGYKTYDPEKEGYGNPGEWRKAFYQKMTTDEAQAILNEDDPYIVLGIPRNASKDVIRRAFYKMAMQWHPDRNPDNLAKAEAMMKKINAAYHLLN